MNTLLLFAIVLSVGTDNTVILLLVKYWFICFNIALTSPTTFNVLILLNAVVKFIISVCILLLVPVFIFKPVRIFFKRINVSGKSLPCGHWLPEQLPEQVYEELNKFLND